MSSALNLKLNTRIEVIWCLYDLWKCHIYLEYILSSPEYKLFYGWEFNFIKHLLLSRRSVEVVSQLENLGLHRFLSKSNFWSYNSPSIERFYGQGCWPCLEQLLLHMMVALSWVSVRWDMSYSVLNLEMLLILCLAIYGVGIFSSLL